MAKSKFDNFIEGLQSNIVRNWKFYIGLFIVILIWSNRKNLLSILKSDDTGSGAVKGNTSLEEKAINNLSTVSINLPTTGGTIETSKIAVSQKHKEYALAIWRHFSTWELSDDERCRICKELLTLSDSDLIIINQVYLETQRTSVYSTLDSLWTDCCKNPFTKYILGQDSEYEAIKARFKKVLENVY